ncbi:pentatricopeptide repeat-containing protein At4g04790, mitochondrial isoform X1 [Arachis hypogaea]|uniref:pentatricopeptide repeat-containing protein At4g04790, mitochondrial isoform X1 n=1 Tax=Arachis hypogaea TaxID=3818 RepID=UPI00110573FC|nr:pentatricopeptide repeat-containing protein At4g21880, mitochondrial-like isoform X1 [Arachis hypogaea]QHO12597.1 Pentatricopeptide repeat-containing protein [Arachis hypogaea]
MRHSYFSYVRNLTRFSSRSRSAAYSSFFSEFDGDSTLASLKLKQSPASDDSSNVAFKKISSIYYGDSISVKKPMSKRNDNAKESQSQPENYLLALCESERKKEILELLEIINIKKLSSVESVEKIFQALGRHQLEPVAENFLLDFKTSDYETNNITNFIASYAVSIPNLSIENVITKFKDLHQTLEVSPSSSSYEKLILHSCTLREVRVALDIVDEMCEEGLTLSNEMLQSILQTCEETSEYNLVHRIFSTIRQYNLETNDKTFRCMIDLFLKMKDLEGAYRKLDEMGELNLKPSASMYNTIMAECFRESTKCIYSIRRQQNMPLHERIISYLEIARLYHFTRLNTHWFYVDEPLVSAFIERWCLKTHTFHMPFGECTIMLQNVAY